VPQASNQLPRAFDLQQNYPNPFNPSTTFQFSLPHESYVTLNIFNILGETVATIVSGELNAGVHVVHFNASSLASGVYIAKLTAGDFNKSVRLSLLK
jgi:hypothetical protein